MTTYSIQLRLQRVTTEHVHVRVPVTELILQKEADADGQRRIDFEALTAEAIRIAASDDVAWALEAAPVIAPHPLQTPAP